MVFWKTLIRRNVWCIPCEFKYFVDFSSQLSTRSVATQWTTFRYEHDFCLYDRLYLTVSQVKFRLICVLGCCKWYEMQTGSHSYDLPLLSLRQMNFRQFFAIRTYVSLGYSLLCFSITVLKFDLRKWRYEYISIGKLSWRMVPLRNCELYWLHTLPYLLWKGVYWRVWWVYLRATWSTPLQLHTGLRRDE